MEELNDDTQSDLVITPEAIEDLADPMLSVACDTDALMATMSYDDDLVNVPFLLTNSLALYISDSDNNEIGKDEEIDISDQLATGKYFPNIDDIIIDDDSPLAENEDLELIKSALAKKISDFLHSYHD